MARRPLLTVGHSTLDVERFLDLLRQHDVTDVLDVRSQPYSRYVPRFNREALTASLASSGIEYHFLGREFGARSPDPDAYDDDGRVRYAAIRGTSAFEQRLLEVITAADAGRQQALLCTEADPADCHRSVLVAHAFYESDLPVAHIRADSRLEDHRELLERISGPPDLFAAGDEERYARGLAQRERAIAYVDPRLASNSDRML
jgi:uncharacterized protein (DUF488 family)